MRRFDYVLAVICAQEPRFVQFQPDRPEIAPNNSSRDGTYAASPLYGDGDFSAVLCVSDQDRIIYLLEVMWGLTARALSVRSDITEARQQHSVNQSSRMPMENMGSHLSLGTLLQTNNGSKLHVFGVLVHAALIYQRALRHPHVPFNSSTNHSDLVTLYEALNATASDCFWLEHPGILLWVLLIGCAVAVTRVERSYFMMFLAKVGIFTEPRCWFETQTAILRFIQIQKLSKR